MQVDVPAGTTFYWNPYSPKLYTIIKNPTSPRTTTASVVSDAQFISSVSSDDEGSFNCFSNCSYNNSMHNLKAAPRDDVYNLGWSTISSVRMEKSTDAAISSMVQRFPRNTLIAMARVIENSPNLFLELCEKERGNVVSHVIQTLKGDDCEELVSMTVEQILRLATNQSGCIALSRIYDGATADQQMSLALALVQHFDALVCHQYGNFALSHITQAGTDVSVFDYMCAQFEQPQMLKLCLNNKFGSHVFEAFVKKCNSAQLFRVCSVLLSDMDQLTEIATSKIANYPLQNALRMMMTHDSQHELSRWALATIPTVVENTKFATNINRALGFAPTAQQRLGSPKHNNAQPRFQ